MMYSLTNNAIIDRLAKYASNAYLNGIYHDLTMEHPIEATIDARRYMTPGQLIESAEAKGCYLKDLPAYIEALRKKYHFDAEKPFFIFVPLSAVCNYSLLQPLLKAPEFKQEYLKGQLANWVYGNLSQCDDGPCPTPPEPGLLDRNTALALVSSIDNVEAIELPESHTIVFSKKRGGSCLYLTYGPLCSFGLLNTLEFSLDNGFLEKEETPFILEMQNYFNEWKARNYEGDLFPSTLAVCPTPASAATGTLAYQKTMPAASSEAKTASQCFGFFEARDTFTQEQDQPSLSAASAASAGR